MSVAILRYEARPHPVAAPVAPALERGDGAAEIGFVRRGAETVLAHLYQRTPCRVLFPRPAENEPATAVLLTTSGGLAGGDRLRIAARAGAGTAASLTTQAAEKIYRSLGPAATIDLALAAEAGSWLEFLPQETILFDGARLVRRTRHEVAAGGRLLAGEMLVFGRLARGERLTRGLVHDAVEVWRDGRLAWVDAMRLDGNIAARLAAPFAAAGATALATALYVGADAASLLPAARDCAEAAAGHGGASLVGGVLIARFIAADAQRLRADFAAYLGCLRHRAGGLPERAPCAWTM